MSVASIRTLIAAERSAFLIAGHVAGTPRTYGDRRTEDTWRGCICSGQWTGLGAHSAPINSSVFMTFTFRVNPRSSAYRGNVSANGPDLDTMVIGALSGIVAGNRRSDRPSLRLLRRASNCWGYAATKRLVDSDLDAGVDITISARVPDSTFRDLLPNADISFTVFCGGGDRRERAKLAAETSNVNRRVFPAHMPIAMSITFSDIDPARNVTSADQVEALIDGIGAAVVGERRLFDPPKGTVSDGRFGYDDSCVYALLVARCHLNDDRIDAVVDIFDDP